MRIHNSIVKVKNLIIIIRQANVGHDEVVEVGLVGAIVEAKFTEAVEKLAAF